MALISFRDNPKQLLAIELILDAKRKLTDVLFDGGARAGKTFVVCYILLTIAMTYQYAGIRILIAREKYNHAVLSIWKQTLIPMINKYFRGYFKIDESYKILRSPWGSEIWLGGLDDKDRTDKIFGQEYAIIFLNEVVQISEQTLIKVNTRLAQKIAGFMNIMIYDCNPRSPAHYIYRMFYKERVAGRAKLTFTPYDNRTNISESLLKRLEAMPETQRRRFLNGEWCEVEGSVYDNVHDRNIIDADKNWARYDYVVGGIDWGYHAAAVVWGIKENTATLLYEFVAIGGKTSQIKRALDKVPWLKREVRFYCDHEPDRIDELCEAGYNAVLAHKEVGAGDGSVGEFELFFDRECPETFQSMLNLMREQDKDGNYTDRHVKAGDHEADATRYALHGGKRDNPVRETHFIKKRVI